MFPCLPTPGNIFAETKFAFQEEKTFPNKFKNTLVPQAMFPNVFFSSFPHVSSVKDVVFPICANSILKFVQTNVFHEKCFLVCPHWET